MTAKGKVARIALVLAFVVGLTALAGLQAAGRGQEGGPVYSLEGAWYGVTTFGGIPPTPTLDTFTSNAQRHAVEGTFLCTIPAAMAGGQSPSGHGNWVRVGTNTFAFTAMRMMITEGGGYLWAKFWGTITPDSADHLTGTINMQLYLPDGTPASAQFTGTLERKRVPITFEPEP